MCAEQKEGNRDLEAILHHVVSDATNVSVDLAEGGTIAVGRVMDSDDDALTGTEDDYTLGGLAFLLAAALQVRGATLLVVDLTTGEGVLLTCDSETVGCEGTHIGALENGGKPGGFVWLNGEAWAAGPERSVVTVDGCVLGG